MFLNEQHFAPCRFRSEHEYILTREREALLGRPISIFAPHYRDESLTLFLGQGEPGSMTPSLMTAVPCASLPLMTCQIQKSGKEDSEPCIDWSEWTRCFFSFVVSFALEASPKLSSGIWRAYAIQIVWPSAIGCMVTNPQVTFHPPLVSWLWLQLPRRPNEDQRYQKKKKKKGMDADWVTSLVVDSLRLRGIGGYL